MWLELDQNGCHRTVLLFGPLAIKVPRFGFGLSWWVRGWLVNLREVHLWRLCKDPGLCPVWLSILGLIIVMPRCATTPEPTPLEVEEARARYKARQGCDSSAEPYGKSYGRLKDRVVAFDYGGVW